jgi:3D (Asp-Asp-Asp) domain-containing protein
MTIRISRDRNEVLELLETVPFQSIRRTDPSLPVGEFRRVQGKRGIRHSEVRLTYSMNQEVGREVLRQWMDPAPQDEIVYEGSKQLSSSALPSATTNSVVRDVLRATATAVARTAPTVISPPKPVSTPATRLSESASVLSTSPREHEPNAPKGKKIRVYATWYNAASAGTPKGDPMYGVTTTGARVDRGIVAVDPKVIPLGTKIYVPGYGNAVAADTGPAVSGNIIDLGFPDGATSNWDSKWLEITILE